MPPHMSADEYQELGRRYYALKQYEQAMEAFSHGIEIAPSLTLYDQRAASFDRLKDYNAAVKDGRQMIKMDKKNVKGYLRTASVLEKMEKLDIALGIYKYGMKNVPVEDRNFKVLHKLHDKVTRKLSPPKSVDPLTMLPVELAEMILEYLSFRHVVNCMRVSRGWRNYLAKLPRLWMHLDLSGARRPVPRSFVDKAVRFSENRLNRVTIHRFEHVDVLKNIAKSCKDLVELDFISLPHTMSSTLLDIVQCAPNLEKLIVRPEITFDTTTQLLQYRPSLEHVSFGRVKRPNHAIRWSGSYPHLETLTLLLEEGGGPLSIGFGSLLTLTPLMQSLTLSNIRVDRNDLAKLPLTNLVLKNALLENGQFPLLPSTLETVLIEGHITVFPNDSALLFSHVPKLTHLTLVGFEKLSPDSLETLLDLHADESEPPKILPVEDARSLESVSFRGVARDGDTRLFDGTNSLYGRSPRVLTPTLKSLDVAMSQCTDDDIDDLLGHKLGLTTIDLSNTEITGASLKMLADKLPLLKSIKADQCHRINGRDAIEYARRKGIAVSCSMGEPKGSRKVRY